ncbi:MAG: DUF1566 domain-containing protein [Desulfopila sp.]|jgi:hypothetical protein|nr:DUF1566 domain-containing protein [Desulfopila sp.]
MMQKKFVIYVLFLSILMPFSAFSAARVVVIPLGSGLAFEPYAPLAASSPSVDNYTVTTLSVTDNTTGLIWEKNASTITMSQESAWSYCQSRTTGGWHTWRLPSIDELQSLLYVATYAPAINSFIFPGTLPEGHWSATTFAGDVDRAWYLHFNSGGIYHNDKTTFHRARCVRGQAALHNKVKDNGNGTVFDLSTGLTWQEQDDGNKRHHSDADTYCQELVLGGKSDWRLPYIKELQSIVDYRTSSPAIDLLSFPATQSGRYWSSDDDSHWPLYTWIVDFDTGAVWSSESTNASYAKQYVRCVR